MKCFVSGVILEKTLLSYLKKAGELSPLFFLKIDCPRQPLDEGNLK
jgi:hypothetical protein